MKRTEEITTYKHKIVCDRCDRSQEWTNADEYDTKPDGWHFVDFADVMPDLCPFCSKGLNDYLESGKPKAAPSGTRTWM